MGYLHHTLYINSGNTHAVPVKLLESEQYPSASVQDKATMPKVTHYPPTLPCIHLVTQN